MQFVISSSCLGELAKSQNASRSPLKGAKRVGGQGASHEGSHWLKEAATVKSALGDYGVRDGIVVSKQTNQLKIWTPELGMFVVDARAVEPSQRTVQWDRKKAEGQTPVKGSVVNVRRPGDKSQWFGRLEDSIENAGPGDTVRVSRGTIGRKAEIVEVERAHILGPHIPTKIKDAEGTFVKDATSRRSAAPSRLQEALAPAAKWRDAPAIEWVHSLKRGRQAQIMAGEDQWFKEHQDDVVRLAIAQSLRMGLSDPAQVEDVVSEAFYGALSALRLWAKRPARQREMTRRKLLERHTQAEVDGMSDEQLRTQRALMRAFAKARAAVIEEEEDFVDAGELDWEAMADDNADRAGEPYDGGGANYASTVIQSEIAEAAGLSPGARYLLEHAIEHGWAMLGDGGGPPIEEARALAAQLREHHGVPHATEANLPGMWLYVKNRLRDAVRNDPALLQALHVPKRGRDQTLAKSLFASEMVDAMDEDGRTERIEGIFKAFESSFSKSFDPNKHPHGEHGWWAHVFHAPPDDFDIGGSFPNQQSDPALHRAIDEFSKLLDKSELRAPALALRWPIRSRDFLKLVCEGNGGLKGISNAMTQRGVQYETAYDFLRDGVIGPEHIDGWQANRAAALPLLPKLIEDPDFILQSKESQPGQPRYVFVRKFQVGGRMFWVGMIADKRLQTLRPISYHPHPNEVADWNRYQAVFSAPGLTWGQTYQPRS